VNGVSAVILVITSRLLIGMLRRVLEKSRHFEVVGEMVDLQNLSNKIVETDADWVILDNEQDMRNLGTINELMKTHPTVRFLTVTTDGSQVRMKSLGFHEKNLSGLSLAEILKVLSQQQDAILKSERSIIKKSN
jgi:DNA-binding NarL/FixJ family response regulator